MAFSPVDPRADEYMRALAAKYDDPVLIEMEERARERGFPIVGRLAGAFIELAASAIGARTVFEMGSGFGYSAYWFSRSVGPGGRVICTDGDEGNRVLAEHYLARAGRWDRVEYHVGWAQEVLNATEGTFDVIYNDIDKGDYPEAWQIARDRVRPGGLYICDNVLWYGRVAEADPEDKHPELTKAIQTHNELVYADAAFDVTIVPIRDGLLVARRR
ncbi:MAG: O-methyltransferase [Thermomicrobiales bacterium]